VELADAVELIGPVEVARARRHGTFAATVRGLERLSPGDPARLEAWRAIAAADEDALAAELESDRRSVPGPLRAALEPVLDTEPRITPEEALWRLQRDDSVRACTGQPPV
jgi:hypothetical protein